MLSLFYICGKISFTLIKIEVSMKLCKLKVNEFLILESTQKLFLVHHSFWKIKHTLDTTYWFFLQTLTLAEESMYHHLLCGTRIDFRFVDFMNIWQLTWWSNFVIRCNSFEALAKWNYLKLNQIFSTFRASGCDLIIWTFDLLHSFGYYRTCWFQMRSC